MLTLPPVSTPPAPTAPLSCERLRAAPAAFALLAGLAPAEFDALLAALGPRHAAAEEARLARPGRKHARGAGRRFRLALADRVLLALVHLRYRPLDWFLGEFFGVGELTAWRTRRRLASLLAGDGHVGLALRRRRLTPRLARRAAEEVPEFAHLFVTFAQWARGPQPPEGSRPLRERKVARPPCPFEELKRRVHELLSAGRQGTS